MKCEVCGISDDSVETVIDPYIREMTGNEVRIDLCSDCYKDKQDSV